MDTKALRQKILDLAIHGKLVPQDPNDEPASVLLERIKAEKERLIKEGKIKRSRKSAKSSDTPHYENVPFEVPEGWVWTTINELCDVVRGGSPRPAGDEKYYNGAIPFLKVADLTKDDGIYVYKAEYTIKEAGLKKTRLVNEGTLLLTNSGATLGVPKITTFPTTFNDGIAAFLYMNREVQLYLYWFIKSKTDSLRKIDQGAAQPNLNTDLIKSIPIPLPPLTEQFRIIKEIEHWFALIDQIEQDKADLQTIIKQTKSKILDLAIHGKLVPQAPNDEPAIELLKRINPDFTPCDNGQYRNIPHTWAWIKLGNLFDAVSAKRVMKSDWKAKGIPFYRAREIVKLSDYNEVNNELFIDNEHYNELKNKYGVPVSGDIMLSAVGTIGKSYIVKNTDKFYYKDASVLCLRNHNQLNSKFFSMLFSTSFLQYQMAEYSKGTTVDTITLEKLKSYIVPLPPLAEQQRIVQKIEELFSILNNIQKALEV